MSSLRGEDSETSETSETSGTSGTAATADTPGETVGETTGASGASAHALTGGAGRNTKATKATKPTRPWWKESLILVGTALVLALIIKSFFVQAFYIPSGSMEQTLEVNDRILVQKVSYWFGTPQRGDIIVFADPANWLGEEDAAQPSNAVTKALSFIGLYPAGGHLVKRVIGVGGDSVRCRDGVVEVNKVPLEESAYVTLPAQACTGVWSVVVPPDRLWVLGDNRTDSADSRVHMGDPGGGFIPTDDVVGKAFVTVWPVDRWHLFQRPATFDNAKLDTAAGFARDVVPLGAFLVLVPTLYRRCTVGLEDATDVPAGEEPDGRPGQA